MRVLLVDDSPIILRVVARALREHDVATASCGADAMAMSGPFDVAIVDVHLGQACGIAVAEQLLKTTRASRVVLFTGGPDTALATRTKHLGPIVDKANFSQLRHALSPKKPASKDAHSTNCCMTGQRQLHA